MLDEKTIRADLERTARQIVSRKLWPVQEASIFLGYSRTWMDTLIDRHEIITRQVGGRKHVYARDILEMFERDNGFEFPELRDRWNQAYKISDDDSDSGQAAGQSSLGL
jgi:hypothetical protein